MRCWSHTKKADMEIWQVYLLSGLVLCVCATQKCQQGISVVAPDVAVPGHVTIVLVTLHGDRRLEPANVTIRLVSDRVEEATQILSETTTQIRGHGVVELDVPAAAAGDYLLQTLVNCSDPGDCQLQRSSALRLVGVVRDVIVRASRKVYRPGSTAFFWVLALDYDLRMVSDIIGSVFLNDPHGVDIALWQEVPLYEGVKSFSFPLSHAAALGRWQVRVEVDGALFSGEFNVSLTGGGGGSDASAPEVAMAEEHYVELRFGMEMRRLYKPGLPFFGKVEAVSTEKSVRVRVKVYDNTTAIYSQDIEISSGEGTFVVPAILADSEVITLQAELVSVEGKEIDSHYVLAREPIHKWNSSSDCYLLIEGVEHTIQPDEHTKAAVLSTCPCERDLRHVVVTEGLVTHWGHEKSSMGVDADRPPAQTVDGTAICRLNFSFEVKAVMAPMSHLLVYYLTDDGEPISDVVSFGVRLQHKEVEVKLEERAYWTPSQPVRVDITAEPGSIVCLVGGRIGTAASDHWIRATTSQASARAASPARELDFLQAGLSYFEQRCVQRAETRDPTARSCQRASSTAGPRDRRRRANVVSVGGIDQLWLWRCLNYSSKMVVTTAAPEEPGKWTLWALNLSPGLGLRFSAPTAVTVFRPLQVDFQLPFSLKVGETVEVDVRIGNNINSCMDVTALLSLSEGAHFLSNTMLYVTEKLRLGPRGATSLVVRLVVTSSGAKNMTAEVSGYGSGNCQEATGVLGNSSLVGSVTSSATMLVHPEGLVQMDTESAYFCANENVVVSTNQDFRYEFVPAPRNRASLVFEVKVQEGAHIALSDVSHASDTMYQVVIGDLTNTVSWIGRGMNGFGVHLVSAETAGIVSGESFRTLWVSWELGVLSAGKGPEPHNNTVVRWRADRKLRVQHIGFASAWGHSAEFRVWSYNDEAGFSQVLHLDVPRSLVPGTEQGTLLVSGGLALPMVARHSSMFYHGLGMGECTSLAATVASFTPLLVPHALRESQNDTLTSQQVAHALSLQLQLLLTFMKPDHSFGDHDKHGNHRDTVDVMLLLAKLQSRVSVDPGLLSRVKRWVQKRQAPDGSFLPLPTDVVAYADDAEEKDPQQRALENRVELTGETLAALLEIGLDTEEDSEVVLRARYFMERSLYRVASPCPLAVLAHALALSRSGLLADALERLQNASTNEEGDFGWQQVDSPHDDRQRRKGADTDTSNVDEYKASLYTLMTFSYLGDLKSSEPVARYLFYRSHLLDIHTELLYVAVKAFSCFGALAADGHRALTVSLATSGMELTDTMELRPDTALQSLQLPSLPTKVFVYATGAGCATVQGQVRYSTYAPARHSPILDVWAGVEDEVIVGHNMLEQVEGKLPLLKLKTCFRWKKSAPSGVLRLEVTLFSGFRLESVSPAVLDSSGKLTEVHHGTLHDKIWFVLANVSRTCAVCLRYNVQSAFLVSSLRPAFARIYPSGRADLGAETFFHARRSSPLLADVTDDDVITWFGSIEAGEPQLSSNFSDVCECGRVCPLANRMKSKDARPFYSRKLQDGTTTITYFSESSQTTTQSNATRAEVANFRPRDLPESVQKEIHNDSRIVNTLMDKGNRSYQINWGGNLKNISEEFKLNLKLAKTNKLLRQDTGTKTQNEVKKLIKRRGAYNASENSPVSKVVLHSVNKEKPGTEIRAMLPNSEGRDTGAFVSSNFDKNGKLFVLDRDTLWGMLKEVVHVEMDKTKSNNGRRKSAE